jgi:hypothetical protein
MGIASYVRLSRRSPPANTLTKFMPYIIDVLLCDYIYLFYAHIVVYIAFSCAVNKHEIKGLYLALAAFEMGDTLPRCATSFSLVTPIHCLSFQKA